MTTATLTWPTATELGRVSELVLNAQQALDALDVNYWQVTLDVSQLDEPRALPTFEALGRLSAFIECVGQDVELMAETVKRIREVQHAAAVRMADDAR